MDAAARSLRRTPPANTSNMQLRPNTSSQRKAKPLFKSYLPDIVTNYNSPERKTEKQWGRNFHKTPSGKRKTHHQKQRRSPFRITTLLFIWTTFFIANTIQYSTVNKSQADQSYFFYFCSYLTFHSFTDRHVHFAVPHVISSRINLANLFMSRTTLNQTQTLHF